MAKKDTIKKTRKPITGKPKWCITKGWGNTDCIVDGWHTCKTSEQAYGELDKAAKGKFPKVYNKVWTQSFLPEGIVCDFGSYVYFGFLKNTEPYTPANLSEPKPTKPPQPVPAPDYLDCPDGVKLRNLFSDWFHGIPKDTDGGTNWWWREHALQYCIMKEWYDMLTEEEPRIDEIWERDLTPDDILCNVLKWSAEGEEAADILCSWRPDERWDAFHAPLNLRREP